MSIKTKLKTLLRDLIPNQFQVPLKYYYNTFQSKIEPEMKLLKYFVKKNDLVIDVGGNRGIYTYKLWKLGANIEVFEPNPTCLKILKPWVEKKSRVNIHPVGLSNSEGVVNLNIPIDSNGVEHDASATIEKINFADSRTQKVSIKTLDGFHFKDVSFIKIDVEGHEYKVLEGMESIISASHPTLLIEIEQRHNEIKILDIFQKILSYEYKGFFLDEQTLVPIENFDLTRHQPLENFESSKGKYINNFVFIFADRLKCGSFDKLIKDFGFVENY